MTRPLTELDEEALVRLAEAVFQSGRYRRAPWLRKWRTWRNHRANVRADRMLRRIMEQTR